MKILNKFNKIKKYIFTFVVAIFGFLLISDANVNAFEFVLYNEGNFNTFSIQNGECIFKLNDKYYYFYNGSYFYVLDSNNNTWNSVTFSNVPSGLSGDRIWVYNDTAYYVYGGDVWTLDTNNNTWNSYSWGSGSNDPQYGNYIYEMYGNYYYGGGSSSSQYYYNASTNKWLPYTLNGISGYFYGQHVWSYNGVYYYTYSGAQYYYDSSSSSWVQQFNSLDSLILGSRVWFYDNVPYVDGYSGTNSKNFYFDISSNKWVQYDRSGMSYLNSAYIWYYNDIPMYTSVYSFAYVDSTTGGGYTEEDLANSYDEGYRVGENAGLITGYNNGYSAGESAGLTTGYNNGYSAGESAGLTTGYNNGYSAGYTDGVNDSTNFGIDVNSCVVSGLVNNSTYNCDDLLSFTAGSFDFSSIRSYLDTNELIGGRYDITLTLTDSISVTDLVVSGLASSNTGSYVSFYSNVSLLYSYDLTSDFTWVDLDNVISGYVSKIVVSSANYDNSVISLTFYDSVTFDDVYDSVYHYAYDNGYDIGSAEGYESGYDRGYIVGADSKNNIIGIVGAIFTGPVTMLSAIFDFEFLGINLSGLILSLTTLLVVIWLVKRFI